MECAAHYRLAASNFPTFRIVIPTRKIEAQSSFSPSPERRGPLTGRTRRSSPTARSMPRPDRLVGASRTSEPVLPQFLHEIVLRGFSVRGGSADVALRRSNRHVVVDVLDRRGSAGSAHCQLTDRVAPALWFSQGPAPACGDSKHLLQSWRIGISPLESPVVDSQLARNSAGAGSSR
jgi:hypothetical protein